MFCAVEEIIKLKAIISFRRIFIPSNCDTISISRKMKICHQNELKKSLVDGMRTHQFFISFFFRQLRQDFSMTFHVPMTFVALDVCYAYDVVRPEFYQFLS